MPEPEEWTIRSHTLSPSRALDLGRPIAGIPTRGMLRESRMLEMIFALKVRALSKDEYNVNSLP